MAQDYRNFWDVLSELAGRGQQGIFAGRQMEEEQKQRGFLDSLKAASAQMDERQFQFNKEKFAHEKEMDELSLQGKFSPVPFLQQEIDPYTQSRITANDALSNLRRAQEEYYRKRPTTSVGKTGANAGLITEIAKRFFQARQVPILDNLKDVAGFVQPPLIGRDTLGVTHNAPDTLMQLLGQQALSPQIPADTTTNDTEVDDIVNQLLLQLLGDGGQ